MRLAEVMRENRHDALKVQAVGMPWYTRENFARLRAMFEDGHKLHRTYDEWLLAAEQGYKSLSTKGHRVVRLNIDPDEFRAWCATKGMKLDANARTEFASWQALRSLGAGEHDA